MPEILSNSFKSDVNRLFVKDALSNEKFYLFVSSIDTFDPEDSQYSKNEFLEKTLFGKRVLNDDIHYMIKYYPWQRGAIYEEYDDRIDLTDQKFYAVVGPNDNDTGDYRVYKCLNNNARAEVTNPPNYSPITPNQIYRTADGYTWKYMYKISELEFEAYNAVGYVPLVDNFDSDPPEANTACQLSDIVVENPDDNFGYVEESGSIVGSPFSSGTIIIDPDTSVSSVTNYYAGQYFYTTNADGITSRLFKITYYRYNQNTGNAEIRVGPCLITGAPNPVSAGVGGVADFRIFPEIKIIGDGEGAVAIPEIIDNRIRSITVLKTGSGYNNIQAEVVDPRIDFNPENTQTTDVRAVIRARLTPPGGHGYNLIDEFGCRHFLLYGYITADDNNKIGATNTYTCVGIVRSPKFSSPTDPDIFDNRIAITSDDVDRVTANTVLIQLDNNNETTFSAVVHDVDSSSNVLYLAEYMGPYVNNANTGSGDTSLDLNLPLRNPTGQTITINSPEANNVIMSDYVQRTGEVYFMENFFPLARTDLSREEFKFVLEF